MKAKADWLIQRAVKGGTEKAARHGLLPLPLRCLCVLVPRPATPPLSHLSSGFLIPAILQQCAPPIAALLKSAFQACLAR